MPVVVAFLSQKGGVGKSTLARALAAVVGHAGFHVRIADLDPQQATVMRWSEIRRSRQLDDTVDVKAYRSADAAIADSQEFDLIILDAPCRTDRSTLATARQANVIVQPTGPSLDDLHPGVLLFHELVAAGIARKRLTFALCRTQTTAEENDARGYLEQAGYEALPGSIVEQSAYRAAHNQGQAITETGRKNLNERAHQLIEGLLMRIGAEAPELSALARGSAATTKVS